MEEIKERLSSFENQVLDAYLDGADYLQIAEMTGKQPKSIDNALQRIKNKIHGVKCKYNYKPVVDTYIIKNP